MLSNRSPSKFQNVNRLQVLAYPRFKRKYVGRQPSVRQCSLVKSLDMPGQISLEKNRNKKEADLVREKVKKTRHEIEELKVQFQQLIDRGIKLTNGDNAKPEQKHENTTSNKDQITEIKTKVVKDNVAETFKPDIIPKKLTSSILKPTGSKPTNTNEPTKKVRHYDQEMAREYIKKQKEKRRKEVNKNKNEDVVAAGLRKQRLQKLQERSLMLVSKNVQMSRERSRSREPPEESIKYNTAVSLDLRSPSPNFSHPHLQNITIRIAPSDDLAKNKAATKIQAVFKGYRQRKIYKQLTKRKMFKQLKEQEVQTQFNPQVSSVKPYPYNFINAVRRKLFLATQPALQTPKNQMIDAAVQSSLKSELKSSNVDLKSFLSHKCLELEPLTLFNNLNSNQTVNVENGCASESDTSKNIPELSSESSISELHFSSKRSSLSDTDCKASLNIEPIKKLKLRQPKSPNLEVSEHLINAALLSTDRDSIIAFNKCNYNSISPKKSVSDNCLSSEPKLSNLQDAITFNFDNKENISQVQTPEENHRTLNGYSSNFTSISTDIPLLEPPKVSLKSTQPTLSSENLDEDFSKKFIQNLRPGEKSTLESKAKTNEIHLKFEAELHVLNDFNDSLRRVMAVEKSLLELRDKKTEDALNYETRDTQTSNRQENQVATVNYSRGSDVTETLSLAKDFSLVTTDLELSPFNSPIEESNSEGSVVKDKLKTPNILNGVSLDMFEQLIRDEDARIENLKAILKIREKSLVDRTKGELAWLEVQKKHLKDAGQLQEISAIKKKQRGLLIKLEHERHEMQRLKQMQKAASKERKSVLREQRNMIKAQLASGNTVTRIKRNTREEKRRSGPFKVYNIKSNNDSIVSETSVTRKSSITEDVISATSNRSHSIISHISEEVVLSEEIHIETNKDSTIRTETVKRSLLMREAALQKRKKVAEELLQWHQRLIEEEKKITELELAASAIINQAPVPKNIDEFKSVKQSFKGSQLNQLWLSLTGRPEKKFKDEEIYKMSQTSLEKFCKNAKKYEKVGAHKKNRNVDMRKPPKSKTSFPSEDADKELTDYASDFESASSISERCQTIYDTTISNQEVDTVNEFVKDESPSEVELRSPKMTIFPDQTELMQDNSSQIVNEILSEIDKYLESQTVASENIESSPDEDVTISSKEASLPRTSDCDKTQEIETGNPSTTNEIQSIPTTPEIEEVSDSSVINNAEDSSKIYSVSENESKERAAKDAADTATSSSANQIILHDSKTVPESIYPSNLTHTSASITDLTKNQTSDQCSESGDDSVLSETETKSNSVISISFPRSTVSNEQSKEGLSCIQNLYKSSSRNTVESSFVSLLEETNKPSEEIATISSASDLDGLTSGTENKGNSVKSLTNDSTTAYVTDLDNSEDLKQSNETDSKILPHLIGKLQSIFDEAQSQDEKKVNGEVPEKFLSSSSVDEIDEDEVSVKDESEKNVITSHQLILDLKVDVVDDKSSSETIDSIAEIEEDEVPYKMSTTDSNHLEDNGNQQTDTTNNIDVAEKLGSPSDEQDSVCEETTIDETEPRLLLSYGCIEEHKEPISARSEESNSANSVESEKECKEKKTDVKKRVSEILADANLSSPRGDRSPRLQDFYVTAYDVASPNNSPSATSPTEDSQQSFTPPSVFGSDEVEELLKKQLEIEQEIKAIQQQQQEQLPYLYVREIPNKPPPPYTPPVNAQSPVKGSVLPTGESEITAITKASSQILYKAISNNVKDVTLSDNAKKFLELKNNVDAHCYEFVFDLCKEFALDHYKQFEPETGPSWTHLQKRTKLAMGKPLDQTGLQKFANKKVKEVFGYEVVRSNENLKSKWSGKKRDHVDELLVVECHAEEAEWTNYDRDELIVKDELTKEIMNMLLSETGQVLNNVLSKKKYLC